MTLFLEKLFFFKIAPPPNAEKTYQKVIIKFPQIRGNVFAEGLPGWPFLKLILRPKIKNNKVT